MQLAAISDNAERIRLLCEAGGDVHKVNLFGITVLDGATSYGSLITLEELLARVHPSPLLLGRGLITASFMCGASVKFVNRLVGLRADINFQCDLTRDWNRFSRFLRALVWPTHVCGLRRTTVSWMTVHLSGMTPLMARMLQL